MARRARPEYLCGVHAVLAALERGRDRVIKLYLAQGRRGVPAQRARDLAEAAGIDIVAKPADALDGMASTGQHQGLVAEVVPTPILDLARFLDDLPPSRPPILFLDGIQDPRNFGAILRTAAALGAAGVVWPKDSAAGLTPVVSKAAAGALEELSLALVTNVARSIKETKTIGYWIIAGDPEGEVTLGEEELPWPSALVVGAEGRGIRRLVRKQCDLGVRISLGGGIVRSLNAAVATGILLQGLISGHRDASQTTSPDSASSEQNKGSLKG